MSVRLFDFGKLPLKLFLTLSSTPLIAKVDDVDDDRNEEDQAC